MAPDDTLLQQQLDAPHDLVDPVEISAVQGRTIVPEHPPRTHSVAYQVRGGADEFPVVPPVHRHKRKIGDAAGDAQALVLAYSCSLLASFLLR